MIHSVPWRQRAAALAQANSAARALQRGTRGFTSRRRVRKLLLRSGACRVLQPALRGFMARRKLLLWEASQGRPSLPALSPLPDARQVGGSGWRYRRLAVWYFFVHWVRSRCKHERRNALGLTSPLTAPASSRRIQPSGTW